VKQECPSQILVYDRITRELRPERVLGDSMLRLAYMSPMRSGLSLALFRSGVASRIMGWYCDSSLSRGKIRKTIESLDIDMSECPRDADDFRSFNAFFTRPLKPDARPFDPDPQVLCAPADARYSVFPELDGATCIPVKGASFTIEQLLKCSGEMAEQFHGGSVIVGRLCPADYHRFHYPASGNTVDSWNVSGRFDSVNPIVLALGVKVFSENRRHISRTSLSYFII